MIVVSDTSPLNYLVLLDVAHVLPNLFGEVIVPPAVLAELSRPETPDAVREWALHPPAWLHLKTPESIVADLDLDRGETEAISVALALKANLLLIDDRKGRRTANLHGLTTVGTLTVLEIAAGRGLVSLPATIAQLRSTNFRVTAALLDAALERDSKRGKPTP